ncbi:metallophosphoesterase 1-like [Mya arenaria]|uniref:metallophosphoesterase 1-like n=1 Tax=Mya arenaria TaxID=6604 RepID=UPI0022E9298C|nr:metallophosphoesterase 1-like [Mya arenaria]XP_052819331.1 metallophosphoesterase 1-like [Mya arenaria]XP_052819332.1 metallophosphoesterase 1-like [Mya arenaria]
MVKKNVKVSVRMMWFCQLPSRFCFYIRTKRLVRVVVLLLLVLFYCEFLHYYIVLLWCTWPHLASPAHQPLRVMIIGDTHILGSNAHWFDKLRREWQMVRSFQASMLIHRPDVVFVLGDLMDYGTESSTQEFHHHVTRFKEMFDTPAHTHMEVIVGNHDIGFHNMMTPKRHDRFKEAFDTPSIRLVTIRDVNFVLVNSMALEGDGCSICSEAESKLRDIKWQLKCSKGKETGKFVADVCEKIETLKYSNPILLQHFPMYRTSDINCSTPDAAPKDERDIPFRNKIDCISKESTDMLFDYLDPRLVISAHTHHGCYRVHGNGVPEYTVASYNWRNKQGPTFFLAEITSKDFVLNRCYLPNEITVFGMYITAGFLAIVCLIIPPVRHKPVLVNGFSTSNKQH